MSAPEESGARAPGEPGDPGDLRASARARGTRPAPPVAAAPPVLGLRDGRVRLLLVLVLLLQLLSLSHLEGYQLADSVEYMDRAQDVVQGKQLSAGTTRSFAFSALLLPIFAAADWLGVDDMRPVVLLVRLLQMALGLFAVLATVRIGARLAGAGAGLAAGFLLGVNPVFLQYTVSPLSATAATLCVVLALEALIDPPDFRRGLKAGAWFGAAMVFAFQVIPIAGLAMGLVLLHGRFRSWRPLGGMLLGASVFVALQIGLDRMIYGSYGSSLAAYLVTNVVGILTRWMWELHLEKAGLWLYDTFVHPGVDQVARETVGDAQLQPPAYYLDHLGLCLVGPALVLMATGLLGALRRRGWFFWLLLLELVLNVALLSSKGSKSFRLWMPLLPLLAILGGLGWELLARPGILRAARRGAALALMGFAALLGARVLLSTNMQKFGAYWRAMDRVNAAAAARGPDAPPLRVASAYHWAVRFRDSPAVELVKLPHLLDLFPKLEPDEQQAVLGELETLDWFLGHGQVLTQDPRVMEVVNRRMEIADVLYDAATFEELAPLFVMRPRGSGPPGAPVHTFFDVIEDADVEAHRAGVQRPVTVDFRRRTEEGVRQLVLLGYDVDPGADDQLAWITYHWWSGPLAGHDYTIVDRVTFGERGAWQNNHRPTYGVRPTSTWREGTIVTESFPIVLPTDPLAFGGAYCRGELVPARLWMAVSERDAEDRPVGGLAPFRPSGRNPRGKRPGPTGVESDDGRVWSRDSLFLVGGFWLPVPAAARVPDDGRRIEDR